MKTGGKMSIGHRGSCGPMDHDQDQCRIYIEAKEAVLGGPGTQGAPKFIK